ncbi:PQQ-binding-like beta-propeller repeat protein [Verrucomicrobiales bacterium]|nr:PQQ-binding-like beta-propeller repeat protein [Verrucomicrobiales bacterium]MDA7926447.1 PQQ-binding-like beta-propeller repeat protein [Verrucomicrobiales bacterium]
MNKVRMIFCFSLLYCFSVSVRADSWPSWRGDILGSGQVAESDLPIKWGAGKNVKWRIDLPEAGNSTPVIFEGKVFVTQPLTADKTRNLMCFSQADGSLLWQKGIVYAKEERTHRSNVFCSASPAVSENFAVVSHGSAGVVAYDHEGAELWKRDFGAIDHVWGNSTSPVIYQDVVIHYHGPAENAVLYGLNKKTGETLWKWDEPVWNPGKRTDGFGDRNEKGVIGSFSTPIVVETAERVELIMSFPQEMKAFDPVTGEVLWTCEGLNPLVYTSPVYADGIVVAMGGYYGNSIGVKAGGSGDVTDSHRLWQEVRHNGGIGTGVAKDGKLYYQNSGGIVFCDDMKTGKTLWKDRLPGAGKSWGSLIIAGDHVYTLSQAGDSVVFEASPDEFKVIAQSDLGEHTNSSIVAADGQLFIRTHEALWCIGK